MSYGLNVRTCTMSLEGLHACFLMLPVGLELMIDELIVFLIDRLVYM